VAHSPWHDKTKTAAQRALPLIDLTNLEEDADDAAIETLCARAKTPFGPVAAVCVRPRFVPLAKERLAGSTVRVAAVANFPVGAPDVDAALAEVEATVAAGADEIDLVFPYAAFLAGDREVGKRMVRAARRACRGRQGGAALLKVILETGRLGDAAAIGAAAADAIDAGADFIKTSTGKTEPGATLPAAQAMLEAIRQARRRRIWSGFKAAGGIRTLAEATPYMALAERLLGAEFVGPATFRLGASRLLDDVLRAIGGGAAVGATNG
jgi:deoxyribose-phosphate aldolase